MGYSISNLSLDNAQILTANYYDDYEFLSYNSFPKLQDTSQSGFDSKYGNNKTLLTGTLVALLDATDKYLYSALYYDKKGQLIQTKSTNHLDEGFEEEYVSYNFTGQPTKKLHIHKAKGKDTQTETYTYDYDYAGRLIATRHNLNNENEIVLASNSYDALGRLKSTTSNGNNKLSTSYTYNIRSWTKSITNPLFSQTLYYNDVVKAHSYSEYQTSYSGNISGEEWSILGEAKRSQRFKYDGLSRLIHTAYNGVAVGGTYNTSYSYDKHGNVLTLARNSGSNGYIDNLTFKYDGTGNQIKFITDEYTKVLPSRFADFKQNRKSTEPYAYNKNGAMSFDPNKGMTIKYNSLNLPQEMLIKNESAKGKNYYTYTATGAKLRVKHLSDPTLLIDPVEGTSNDYKYGSPNTTDYVGNKIYENGVLNKILTDNGYYEVKEKKYYFYIKDHLGNNRVVADASGSVVQRNNYYPFGMSYGEESDAEQGKQNFKYNGKELDKTHGLNQYDYAARHMDPATIRFTSVDPLAEKYYSVSPYAYVGNNPIRRTDPSGMIWDDPNEAYRLKKSIDKRIEALNKNIVKDQLALAKEGNSYKKNKSLENNISKAKKDINNLNTSKGDIDKLGADQNNTYAVSNTAGGKHFVRKGDNGKVYIEASSDGILIHEISHVRQSLDSGGLEFSGNGFLKNSGSNLKGKSDVEVESYQLEYSFDKSFPGNLYGKGISGINYHSVGNIKDENGNHVYEHIKAYSDLIKRAQKINENNK